LLFNYVDAFPAWDLAMDDGLAYNRLTGDLYASGDGTGVYQIDRRTGLIIIDPTTGQKKNVGNNAHPPDTRFIGTDLAIQADTIPLVGPVPVPDPATLLLIGLGLAVIGYARHRIV